MPTGRLSRSTWTLSTSQQASRNVACLRTGTNESVASHDHAVRLRRYSCFWEVRSMTLGTSYASFLQAVAVLKAVRCDPGTAMQVAALLVTARTGQTVSLLISAPRHHEM